MNVCVDFQLLDLVASPPVAGITGTFPLSRVLAAITALDKLIISPVVFPAPSIL